MHLVSYNIQYGRGKDGRFDLERIAGEIEGADVVALQEVDRYWSRSGMVDQARALARLLGFEHWAYGPGVDLHLSDAPPDAPPGARRQFGNAVLAREPLLWARNHLLPKYASAGRAVSLQRSALETVIETSTGALRVYSVHLTHLSAETRRPQIERLLGIHRDACREGAPIACSEDAADWLDGGLPPAMPRDALLLGDFNLEHDSLEYPLLAGPESPYGGRIANPEAFVDAWVAAGHDESEGVSADVRGRPARLDYCFVSTPLAARVRSARIDAEAEGSDHQPLWVEIDL